MEARVDHRRDRDRRDHDAKTGTQQEGTMNLKEGKGTGGRGEEDLYPKPVSMLVSVRTWFTKV